MIARTFINRFVFSIKQKRVISYNYKFIEDESPLSWFPHAAPDLTFYDRGAGCIYGEFQG